MEKYFSAISNEKIGLEKIRKAAVCHFYDNLKKAGERPLTCLEKTADFARLNLNSTENLLLDQTKPIVAKPDTKPDTVRAYFEEIEDLVLSLRNSEDPKDRGDRDAISHKIENDPDLKADDKDALKKWLNESVDSAIDQPRVKSEPPPPKNFNEALREATLNLQDSDRGFDENDIPDDLRG